MENIKLETHTVVVGGTRGIGRAVARTMAAANQTVSAIGRSTPSESDRNTPGIRHWSADLLDVEGLANIFSGIIREQGPVNHLIFAQRYRGAGDEWAGEIETGLTATKNVIEQLADKFADSDQRSIVIVSSIASRLIAGEQPVGYHVAKAGLHQMVRYYAVTLGRLGIRVNSVSPGTIVKEESKDFYLKNHRLRELYNGITPLGRMGTSDDVAGVISFLCSPQSSFVSGQDIVIDGGRSLVWQETLAREIADLDELSVTSRGS